MRRMTGSQRKAKKKQRTINRRPKKSKSYVTLYHGILVSSGGSNHSRKVTADLRDSIHTTGFRNWQSTAKPERFVHQTLTTDRVYAGYGFGRKRPIRSKSKRANKYPTGLGIRRGQEIGRVDVPYGPRVVPTKGSIVKIQIPKKDVHKYVIRGEWNESARYIPNRKASKKQNYYGLKRTIPSKYIK